MGMIIRHKSGHWRPIFDGQATLNQFKSGIEYLAVGAQPKDIADMSSSSCGYFPQIQLHETASFNAADSFRAQLAMMLRSLTISQNPSAAEGDKARTYRSQIPKRAKSQLHPCGTSL